MTEVQLVAFLHLDPGTRIQREPAAAAFACPRTPAGRSLRDPIPYWEEPMRLPPYRKEPVRRRPHRKV